MQGLRNVAYISIVVGLVLCHPCPQALGREEGPRLLRRLLALNVLCEDTFRAEGSGPFAAIGSAIKVRLAPRSTWQLYRMGIFPNHA